jgi:hypothetical protein
MRVTLVLATQLDAGCQLSPGRLGISRHPRLMEMPKVICNVWLGYGGYCQEVEGCKH